MESTMASSAPAPRRRLLVVEEGASDSVSTSAHAKRNQDKLAKEAREREYWAAHEDEGRDLYPNLNDPLFNLKIAEKKEFHETQYDGTIDEDTDIETQADRLSKREMELSPHQTFVRNFLSFQTPYNSLLLYHGLGSGKTLTSIGVCEEMRKYMQQTGMKKRILIVASPNVQENFRTQLFDERKLVLVDGVWTYQGPIGGRFLRETNPTQLRGLSREKVVSQVKALVNRAYQFMGYESFANDIKHKETGAREVAVAEEMPTTTKKNKQRFTEGLVPLTDRIRRHLDREYNGRLVVIDEIHNIRITDDNDNKKVAVYLMRLVESAKNMRLLLLSATPLYNSPKEIVYLLNLMNANEGRAKLEVKQVFDGQGNFVPGGEELLVRKATGYVSFVRGENPFTFPYRIYPKWFAPSHSSLKTGTRYPLRQMNGKEIDADVAANLHTDVYLTQVGEVQAQCYQMVMDQWSEADRRLQGATFTALDSFGYTLLQLPLEVLNMSYPVTASGSERPDAAQLTGRRGLESVMRIQVDERTGQRQFSYQSAWESASARPFAPDNIGQYSAKIKAICESVVKAEGIVLVYSQYLDAGLVPLALALEEYGLTRYAPAAAAGGSGAGFAARNLLAPGTVQLGAGAGAGADKKGRGLRYAMVTGDPRLSPHNGDDVKALTDKANLRGELVKVVLISQAGAEGIDFKAIRQVHIMEPWFNLNRVEQIIGRAVRHLSHKDLPFAERNTLLFLHGSTLPGEARDTEAADRYVYRMAEKKAQQMGRVTRLLKEISVDCLLNHEQTNFSQATFASLGKTVRQTLSNGRVLEAFPLGDAPFTSACDYQETCEYKCRPRHVDNIAERDLVESTYHESFVMHNMERLVQKIKSLFSDKVDGRYFYRRADLMKWVNPDHRYPEEQVLAALTQLVDDPNETVTDKLGRSGYLVNVDDYYLYQPHELNNHHIPLYERSVPLDQKPDAVTFVINPRALKTEQLREEGEADEIAETQAVATAKGLAKVRKQMRAAYALVREYAGLAPETVANLKMKEEDAYEKYAGLVIQRLEKEYGIDRALLLRFYVYHLLDVLDYPSKRLLLLEGLGATRDDDTEDAAWEREARHYLDEKKVVVSKQFTFVVLFEGNRRHDWVREEAGWRPAQPADEDIIETALEKKYKERTFSKDVGFISTKSNKATEQTEVVFKIRDMGEAGAGKKRHTGADCAGAGKAKQLELINKLVKEMTRLDLLPGPARVYDKNNTKDIKGGLCCLLEMLMRFANSKEPVCWFADVDESQLLSWGTSTSKKD